MSNSRRKPYQGAKPKRSRTRAVRKLIKNRRFWIVLGVFFGSIGMLQVLIFGTPFRVTAIEVRGADSDDIARLRSLVEAAYPKNILFLESRSILLAETGNALQDIKAVFPEIQEAKIEMKFPKTLVLHVVKRQQFAAICQEQCYLMDREGIVFGIANEARPDLEIRYPAEKQIEIGKQIMSGQEAVFISEFYNAVHNSSLFQANKTAIESFSFDSSAKIRARISEGWEVYLDPNESWEWQATKLLAVLEKELPIEERIGLQYIDVRYGDKAFYQ